MNGMATTQQPTIQFFKWIIFNLNNNYLKNISHKFII